MNSRFVIMCQAVSLLILAGCGNTGAVKETVLGQDEHVLYYDLNKVSR